MTYTYFWPPDSEPPDYEPQSYDRGLGVDRDPSWQTRGVPDRPTVWPVGIYWLKKYEKPQLVKCDIEGWNLADFKTFISIVKWIQKCADGLDEFERNRMGRKHHESNF